MPYVSRDYGTFSHLTFCFKKRDFQSAKNIFGLKKVRFLPENSKKQNKTGYKKPLKALGFSRVKVAQREGCNSNIVACFYCFYQSIAKVFAL